VELSPASDRLVFRGDLWKERLTWMKGYLWPTGSAQRILEHMPRRSPND